jgi:uncharacterized protein (TIGR03435 family)
MEISMRAGDRRVAPLTYEDIRSNVLIKGVRRMRLMSTLVSAWTVLAPVAIGLHAQAVEPRPAFEVVSITPRDNNRRPGPPRIDPGRVSYPNATLKFLIARAYDVANYQLHGPSWLDESNSFSFSAKIPDGASETQVPAMLQTMLADRFALKVHWESRVQPVFALLVGKGGSKLKKSDLSIADNGPDGRPTSSLDVHPDTGHFAFRTTTMGQFARFLSSQLGRPVLDMTEMPGMFDIEFEANPADLDGLRKVSAAEGLPLGDDSTYSSIFTGMQALGLKLESRKEPIRHLIVDSALKVPTEN